MPRPPTKLPSLLGVVHLAPLPGSPRSALPMDAIVEAAIADARALEAAGFDGVIVENFGDAPFTKAHVPPASLAALAVVTAEVRRAIRLPLGVNALRNDALGALGVAVATGASLVRVNVHVGVAATDQGLVEGAAAETLAYRRLLGASVAILADVHVKHARPLSATSITQAARDTAYRGLADGLIVSGEATGAPAARGDLEAVRRAVPDRPLYVGSGATEATARELLAIADGLIVGTSVKVDGLTANPVDPARAARLVRAARATSRTHATRRTRRGLTRRERPRR